MARITVVGGTGYAGGHVVAMAASRGHEVTSWSRSLPEQKVEGVTYATGDVRDDHVLAQVVRGADVLVTALSPRGDLAGEGVQRALQQRIAAAAKEAGVRLGVVGGAGSLLVAEGGPKVHETDGFPEEFRPEAQEMGGVLEDLRAGDPELDWFFVSPAGTFGAYAPGEYTGSYRVGGDVLLTDENGESFISGPDFALAMVEEIENPTHRRQRFTVAR